LNVKIIGLANSRKMIIDRNSIEPAEWEPKLFDSGTKTNLDDFIDEMKD